MPSHRGSRKERVLALVLDGVLIAAFVAVPAYGIASFNGGAATAAEQAPPPDPALLISACMDVTELWRMDCYLSAIYPVVDSHGVAVAFQLLQDLADRDPWVRTKDHPLAHSLGRESYDRLGDTSKVLVHCPYGMASGCFHGTLEAFFASQGGAVGAPEARTLCDPVLAARGPFGQFQCLHGLGHGVTISSDHELDAALSLCDGLADVWSRESCYGGAFMENIVSYQVWSGLGVGEGVLHNHNDEEGETHHGWIYADDPQYPCNAVEPRYKGACYNLQTTAFLTLNGYNVAQAFSLCDAAESDWVWMCYLSMGRDISSISNRNADVARDQCGWGNASMRSWCVVGVVKDFMNSAGSADPGFTFCQIVNAVDKTACYEAAGEMLATLVPDRDARKESCADAEPPWVDACLQGAGA